MNRKEYDRQRYLARKEEGLCVKNGCPNEAIHGETLCDYHKDAGEERYDINRSMGLCRCGRPRHKDRKQCIDCLCSKAITQKRKYWEKKNAGI